MNPLSAISPLMSNSGMLPMPGLDQTAAMGGAQNLGMTNPVQNPFSATGVERPALGAAQSASRVTEDASGPNSFSGLLKQFVDEVNTKQTRAKEAVRELQQGGDVSLHDTMIAMEEASLSFMLMIEVRNKLQESYQEIMRMQV